MINQLKQNKSFEVNRCKDMIEGIINANSINLYIKSFVDFIGYSGDYEYTITKKKLKISLNNCDDPVIINYIDELVKELNRPTIKKEKVVVTEKKRVSILEV